MFHSTMEFTVYASTYQETIAAAQDQLAEFGFPLEGTEVNLTISPLATIRGTHWRTQVFASTAIEQPNIDQL